MSKFSRSARKAAEATARSSYALNQGQSGATSDGYDCNLTYSEFQLPISMSGIAAPPRSHAHKWSRDESRRNAQRINYGYPSSADWQDGEGSYGAQTPNVPYRIPDAGPASLYDSTFRTDAGQTGDPATNDNDNAEGWVTADDYSRYRTRYDRASNLNAPMSVNEENFVALCKATVGWSEQEVGDLLAEARALDRLAEKAVAPSDFPAALAAQLDVETGWVRDFRQGKDQMLSMLPGGFDWWNSETYRSVTTSRMQRNWASQRTA